MKKTPTTTEARDIGRQIGVDFAVMDLEQFRLGLAGELEHGSARAEPVSPVMTLPRLEDAYEHETQAARPRSRAKKG